MQGGVVTGKIRQVALHVFGVWLRVMLQKFCVPLVNFHTVLLYVLGVSSHEQVTTDLEEQKLSHMRRACIYHSVELFKLD